MELKRELTVSPGQSTAVEAELLRADLDGTPPTPLLVEWSCEVLEYDLAVGAELFAGGERLAVVYPQRRVASTSACAFVLPRGCAMPVVFRVALDNSFSLLRGKSATVVVTARAADDPAAASALESASRLLDVGDARVCNARATAALKRFYTNRFDDAEVAFRRESDRVPVFALGFATMAWLRAVMEMDARSIEVARARLDAASLVAAAGGPAAGAGLADASPAELDALVVSAELLLLRGMLHLLDESVTGLVQCALGVRAAYLIYARVDREVFAGAISAPRGAAPVPPLERGFEIAEVSEDGGGGEGGPAKERPPPPVLQQDARSRAFVRSGLEFGLGTFSVVISVLPPFLLQILAWAGFPSSREVGMRCLRQCLLGGGVRFGLASMNLLGMQVIMPSFHSGADLTQHAGEASAVTEGTLERLPESALYLWFAGRQARALMDAEAADALLRRCADATRESGLPPLAQLADYERMLIAAFRGEWAAARSFAAGLERDNSWSKVFYAFVQAVAMLETGRPRAARDGMRATLRVSLKRLAGRVVAAEQWAVKRAAEFVALTRGGGGDDEGAGAGALLLPEAVAPGSGVAAALDAFPAPLLALELVYFWGGLLQSRAEQLEAAIARTDAALAAVAAGRVFCTRAFEMSNDVSARAAAPAAHVGGPPGAGAVVGALAAAAQARVNQRVGEGGGGGARVGAGVLASLFSGLSVGGAGAVGGESSFAAVSPLLPAHVAAVAALVRGAACASLGRADEAEEALSWVLAGAGGGAGPSGAGRRELHVFAYAAYELGTLFLVLARALAPGGAEGTGAGASAKSGVQGLAAYAELRAARIARLLASRLAKGTGAAAARERAASYFAVARGVSQDFPFKVRLLVRLHLAAIELADLGGS